MIGVCALRVHVLVRSQCVTPHFVEKQTCDFEVISMRDCVVERRPFRAIFRFNVGVETKTY